MFHGRAVLHQARGATLVVRATALQPWQLSRLQQAAGQGRRSVKVRCDTCMHLAGCTTCGGGFKGTSPLDKTHWPEHVLQVEKLCKELQLPRATVLQWLKEHAPPPAEPAT